MKTLLLCMVGCAILASCNSSQKKSSSEDENVVKTATASMVEKKEAIVDDKLMDYFRNGIRTEAVDGSNKSIYVLFSQDSLKAEIYVSDGKKAETLEQRTLPSGEHVWNIEDDDTKNLRKIDGCWTISQRGKLLFKQQNSDCETNSGNWKESYYEGVLPAADCSGMKYQLHLRNKTKSNEGHFLMYITYLEAENGKDVTYTYMGKRNIRHGIPTDKNAVVWQLISDSEPDVYNLLWEKDGQVLTFISKDFKKIQSELNYSLNKMK